MQVLQGWRQIDDKMPSFSRLSAYLLTILFQITNLWVFQYKDDRVNVVPLTKLQRNEVSGTRSTKALLVSDTLI